ncbi:MAG: heparinase II/III domain-containing protein, partial [Promethearchaeota archaeon]
MVINRKLEKKHVKAIFLFVLAITTGFVGVWVGNLFFPDNKGFTRNILFVRPRESSREPGYFIIIDDFNKGQKIDAVFHSYGNLSVNASGNEAYFTNDSVDMRLKFIGYDVSIENKTGFAYKTYPDRPGNDVVEYIKVKPSVQGMSRLITLVTFSNSTISHPQVSVIDSGGQITLIVNGTDVFVFPRLDLLHSSLNKGGIEVNGKFFGYRNDSVDGLEWVIYAGASKVSRDGQVIYSGKSASAFYNVTNASLAFTGAGNGSPVDAEKSTAFDQALISNLVHPYLLYNKSELVEIKNKCKNIDPWKTWYERLGSSVIDKSFKGIIDGNVTLIDQAVQLMLDIDDRIDWENEQFITRSTTLYPYLFAYDIIYNNISESNRTIIEQKFINKLVVLADAINSGGVPTNNHIVVASAALGIGGLLFKNSTWVQLTQDMNDFYLEKRIRPNGACYEGAIYGRYTYDQAVKFFLALKHVGGYDYFKNGRFLKYLNYTVSSMTPLGWTPVFEDCAIKSHLGGIASLSAYPVNSTNPELASNLKWYFVRVYNGELNGGSVYRIISYEAGINSSEPKLVGNQGYAYFDSGYSVIRTGWDKNATYLVISNKNYLQSHVHLDENSIEIYSMGKKFLTNPGYPHWRKPGHDYTISTEASNTLLINGDGQLNVVSDGFSGYIQNDNVDFLISPSLKAYQSPFNPMNNLAYVSILFTVVALLGLMGIVYLVVNAKKDSQGKIDRVVRKEINGTGNGNGKLMDRKDRLKSFFFFNKETLAMDRHDSFKHSALSTLVLTGIQSIGVIYIINGLIDYVLYQIKYIEIDQDLRESLFEYGPLVKLVNLFVTPAMIFLVFSIFFLMIALTFY